LFALAHYLYILAVTIPFDIRDLKFDDSSQKTIPQIAGVKGAKAIAIISMSLFVTLVIWLKVSLLFNPLFIVAVAVQTVLILATTKSRGDLYCAGGIDGAIALLGLAYLFN